MSAGTTPRLTPSAASANVSRTMTRVLVIEEIGRHDSAAAWTLENPLDWAFLCCRLPDEGAEEIYDRGADILIAGQFVFLAQMPLAQAAMIGTPQAMQEQTQQQHHPVDQAQLRAMLDDKQVQQKLESLGVPREQVEARIASLTPAELQQFNQRLEQEPAGGWVGIIVLFLVIFIITDMLCATDIFSFIKCIN